MPQQKLSDMTETSGDGERRVCDEEISSKTDKNTLAGGGVLEKRPRVCLFQCCHPCSSAPLLPPVPAPATVRLATTGQIQLGPTRRRATGLVNLASASIMSVEAQVHVQRGKEALAYAPTPRTNEKMLLDSCVCFDLQRSSAKMW